MKVEGQCHCGNISYEAEIDPEKVHLCHCTDCQALTGSAFRVTVQAPSASFRLLTGQPKTYIKTAASGNRRIHAFCPDCGSPVYACAVSDPPTYSLRLGCLKQRMQIKPTRQIWCDSALPWAMNLEDLPRLGRQ